MKYAYIEDNVVSDICEVPPANIFLPDYAAQFIDAPDYVDLGWGYVNGEWVAPPPPNYAEQNKQQAQTLLQQTDWTCTVDITNPQYSNPYLTNQDEFLAYRSTVRAIAVNPPTTPAVFPIQPVPTWSE